jgi:hypothetical protein
MNNMMNAQRRSNTIPYPHSLLECKHLSIAVTHRTISGETTQCIMSVVLPSGLPRGSIVLEGFVGNLFRDEPGSDQEV